MSHLRTSRTFLLVALAASLILLLPSPALARGHFGIGFYGPGFWGGPYWGGPYYGYWGGPWGYWGPWGYPGYYGYGYGRPLGEVHIKSPDPDAQIYINGSLAGRAHDLKHFYLRPGRYVIEQRIGNDVQKQRIYVLADRNLRIEFGKPGTPSPQPMAPPEPQAEPQPGANGNPPPPPPPEGGY